MNSQFITKTEGVGFAIGGGSSDISKDGINGGGSGCIFKDGITKLGRHGEGLGINGGGSSC